MTEDDAGFPRWGPDQDAWDRWHQALAAAAERLHDERGIADPWQLAVGWEVLWAEYGDLSLRVAGVGADLGGPDDLFDEIDRWAAWDRPAGPGRVLDRDRQVMAAWRVRLPELQQFWEGVARRVFRDVEATTDLVPTWEVVVHEDETVWPGLPYPGTGGVAWLNPDGDTHELPRRPLDFPEVWLETPHTHRQLPDLTDEDEAISHLADELQDDVIEEVHGAWPQCPRHPHPLSVGDTDDGRPAWVCPDAPDVTVPIGELGRRAGPAS